METYNYLQAVKDSVEDYINGEVNLADYTDRDELEQELNDDLFIYDSVTGNASGSYFFNTYKAEEALCHNWDLLADAIDEFGGSTDVLRQGAEACDVTIRCYLLPQAIAEVLDEMDLDFESENETGEEIEGELYYAYAMLERPVGIGCQPKDFVKFDDVDADMGYYDIVYYNRKLADEELDEYEMKYLFEVYEDAEE